MGGGVGGAVTSRTDDIRSRPVAASAFWTRLAFRVIMVATDSSGTFMLSMFLTCASIRTTPDDACSRRRPLQ